MLAVYRAISFQRVLERGARTKPWLVLVQTRDRVESYVVKLFDTSQIIEKDSVANEVIGNVLAREFHLPVPSAALIELDADFLRTVRDPVLIDLLKKKDDRIKFGTVELPGVFRYDAATTTLAEARRMIEIDSVFAFDNLIRNPDRNEIKPNILARTKEAFLIDHELGFEIRAEIIQELASWIRSQRYYRYHIFYKLLKGAGHGEKQWFFNEFEECLRTLNVNVLQPYYRQLADHGYASPKHKVTMDYLFEMKRKSVNFVNLLRGLIS
jgi:hypothetical protein